VLFSVLERDFASWSSVSASQSVPTIGPAAEISTEPVNVDRARLKEIFSTGISELESVFRSILSPSTVGELQKIAALSNEDFRYPLELWAKTVYEFVASYHKSVISRDHIIQALAPLYRGRALSFLNENQDVSAEDIERSLECLCREFERLKPYLLEMWNGGK
jgi:hypothetical protein